MLFQMNLSIHSNFNEFIPKWVTNAKISTSLQFFPTLDDLKPWSPYGKRSRTHRRRDRFGWRSSAPVRRIASESCCVNRRRSLAGAPRNLSPKWTMRWTGRGTFFAASIKFKMALEFSHLARRGWTRSGSFFQDFLFVSGHSALWLVGFEFLALVVVFACVIVLVISGCSKKRDF
jgi:hypothetical protein